ncbi:MAG: 30S ribosome-binding factor RbfA [Candidatus Desulfofervidaceae bacterium]|nr:30S ribosome-binding factor RbfA [Candidatus Desulfofervidaceae bacterium]MDL1969527.1 30S ribosome-binding factor RbfA [Candidatus Desulfofervidaceae bacterium]
MGNYARASRVAGLFQREMADILLRKIADPRLQGVTITRVVLSADLKQATIFFDIWGLEQRDAGRVLAGFESAQNLIRKELAQRVRLKTMPKLKFVFNQGS